MSRALLVGLSGCSSSGKTTLARLLREIWPESLILHEDDFYWPDEKIPVKDGVQDWDCLESIDVEKLHECLTYIKANGTTPPDFQSKEDQNNIGVIDVAQAAVQHCTERAREIIADRNSTRIIFIDGFLLYSESMVQIRDQLDVKLFLRTDYQTAKARREASSGYVTIEGFWEDPPGYVDKIVWPNYVQDHGFLFQVGNVEGSFDDKVCARVGVHPVPNEGRKNMMFCVQWACRIIEDALT